MEYNLKILDYGQNNLDLHYYSFNRKKSDGFDITDAVDFDFTLRESTDNDIIKELHSINSSLSRTKNTIYDYCRSNKWEWFCTFTFSPNLVDRTDYTMCYKKISKWFQNIKRRAPNLKYILIPELHKKNKIGDNYAWHFHALITDCAGLHFEEYICRNNKPLTIKGRLIYTIKEYTLGFCNAQKIEDTTKISRYITKYITKEFCFKTKGRQRYLCSKGLKKPKEYYLHVDDIQDLYQIFNITYEKNYDVNAPNYHYFIKYLQSQEVDLDCILIELKNKKGWYAL